MSSIEKHFRTVVFGGFHKRDVIDYIAASSREFQERDAGLEMTAQQARQEREELAEKLKNAETARKKNAEECERMSASLTERTAALERAEKELAERRAEQEKMAARLAELENKLPGLEEDAAAYAALKDRLAILELESQRKAMETVEQARDQAAKIRGELENWLRRVQSGYQHLRTDVSATVTHLTGELEQCKRALEEAAPAFGQYDEALAELMDYERSAIGPKVPEPLPLDETEDVVDHG